MNIRSLSENDLIFIAAEKANFPDGWNYDMLLSSFKTGRFNGFIAEDEKTPIGFITYSVIAPDADIESVYVKKEYRKKGVASALILAASGDIKRKGCEKIFLEVRESNLSAINLYVKCGFKKISERKKYYGDETAAVLIKEI